MATNLTSSLVISSLVSYQQGQERSPPVQASDSLASCDLKPSPQNVGKASEPWVESRTVRNLFRQLSKLSSWPDSAASIGALIDTGTKRMGRSKAWIAQGPAHDIFESLIRPELESLLVNCGICDGAPLFLRDYMIGPSEDKALPTVMICCVDKKIRNEAEKATRESGLAKQHGFKVGTSVLCLEAKTLPIKCMGHLPTQSECTLDFLDSFGIDSTKYQSRKLQGPLVGRTLLFIDPTTSRRRVATGGPVVSVGGALCQLTAAHILSDHGNDTVPVEVEDLDDVCLEDMSDNEETEWHEVPGGKTDDSSFLPSIESKSSKNKLHSRSYFPTSPALTSAQSLEELVRNRAAANAIDNFSCPGKPCRLDLEVLPQTSPSSWSFAGKTSTSSSVNLGLDYLLFDISPENSHGTASWMMNRVDFMVNDEAGGGQVKNSIYIQEVGAIATSETRILAVITSGGVVSGTLLPGATSYIGAGMHSFQKLYVVNLDGQIAQGDCGGAVIDSSNGCLYGHIVLGVPGTSLAYIVSATEVFDDIKNRTGLEVSLNLRYCLVTTLLAQLECVKELCECKTSQLEQEMDRLHRMTYETIGSMELSMPANGSVSEALQQAKDLSQRIDWELGEWTQEINRLNDAWEFSEEKDYRSRLPLDALDKLLTELRSFHVKLSNTKSKHDDYLKSVERYLQVHSGRAIVLQQCDIGLIDLVQLISSSSLASVMMQTGVLPWESGFLPWLLITANLWVMTTIIQSALKWFDVKKDPKTRSTPVSPDAEKGTPDHGQSSLGLLQPLLTNDQFRRLLAFTRSPLSTFLQITLASKRSG